MADDTYLFGEFSMSVRERRLLRGGKCVALPPKAFDALHLMVRRHENLVSRTEIYSTLWPGIHVSEANLTNVIVVLRKALGRDSIQTVSKFGYRFTLPVTGEPGVMQAAYESFVRGKELLAERSPDSIVRAQDLFWLCIARDPQFAAPWAWLGRSRRLLEKFKGHPGTPDLAEAAFQRAFAIDPELSCAHQFYTQLQVDSGRASEAMIRLAARLARHGEDAESFAGLVQVLRCCGLLEKSVAAHERAAALDPTIRTSVAHTHFLRGAFARVFETYTGTLYYLDAAAWAALGATERAATLLRERLAKPELGPVMSVLMTSLLAILDGKLAEAMDLIEDTEVVQEPEVLFYLARHCGMLSAAEPTVRTLRRARLEGFWSSCTLKQDPVFAGLRNLPEFECEIHEAERLEARASELLQQALGSRSGWLSS
jgi:DNA-binding winged helix-turn-helix (wHTH) protein